MADHYEDYTREQLMRMLRECDKRPRFGPVGGPGGPNQSPNLFVNNLSYLMSSWNREDRKSVDHRDLKSVLFAAIAVIVSSTCNYLSPPILI